MFADSLKKVFFVVFLLFFNNLLSFSQHKNFNISRSFPSWIVKINTDGEKVKAKDVVDGYYASLMEAQHHVELQERFLHVFREITSEAGVQNGSQLSITYDPSYQKLTVHKVTVWRNNQPIDKLNGTKFTVLQNEKDLSKFIYSGTFDAYLLLDDIRKGDRIEYAYTLKGNNPIWGDKFTEELYFEGPYSTGHLYTNVIVSKKRKLNFKSFNFNGKPKVSNKDALTLYEWESRNTQTYLNSKYATSWFNPFKRTQISEYQSWEEIVDWGLKVNKYPGLQTPGLDKLAQEFRFKANNDPLKYIELATRFAQDEIRYMGIEIGEYSQRPNSPEKVLKQRYGDCKDKSLLLINLLNTANIPAYMAYISTYSGQKLNDFLPSPFLFNHAVVVVEYQNKKIWIDPTVSYQRGPINKNYFPDYGYGLVLKAGVKRPERVVSLSTGKLIANSLFTVADTSNSKKTTLTITSKYSDNYADNLRSSLAAEGTESVEKSYLDYLKNYYPEADNKAPIHIKDNETDNIIEITESYTIDDIWQLEDTKNPRTYINFYGDLISPNLININLKDRTEPLALNYPVDIEQHVSLTLPFTPGFTYETKTVENEFFHFEYDNAINGSTITLHYYFKSLKDDVPLENLKSYIKDSKKATDLLSYTIFFYNAQYYGSLNYYLLALSGITIIVAFFFLRRIYQQQWDFDIEEITEAPPIRGWLILLGISLIASSISLPIQVINTEIFLSGTWDTLTLHSDILCFLTRTTVIIEVIVWSLQYSWLILLIILFFKRRDILPDQFVKYLIFSTSFLIFDAAMAFFINYAANESVITVNNPAKLLGQVIWPILWRLYFINSSRVARTFVFTYPESSWKNAIHEQQNTLPQKD